MGVQLTEKRRMDKGMQVLIVGGVGVGWPFELRSGI
jgi:hypothetical protein